MTQYLSVPENSTGRTVGLRDACGSCGPAASPGASEDGILDPQNLEGLWLGGAYTLCLCLLLGWWEWLTNVMRRLTCYAK